MTGHELSNDPVLQASIILPSVCTPFSWAGSSFRFWLLISGVVPLVAIFITSVCATTMHCARMGWNLKNVYVGVLDALPFALFLSYCLVPSVSKTIFQSWSCIAYEFDVSDVNSISYYSYLRNDLYVRCSEYGFSNPEHDAIEADAVVLMAIWPIGMVVLYAVTLLPCRSSLNARELTPLNRSTRFLHGDYRLDWFAWELLDLNRRAVLVGWVIFIFDTDRAFLRLVTALLVSIASLTLLLSTYPYAYASHGMQLVHMALRSTLRGSIVSAVL